MALLTPLNDLDSNLHLDYIRAIQELGTIPSYHPHLYQSAASKVPFPYPIGYHLAMALFPHSVPLYKAMGVIFAAASLVLVLKLNELLGFKKNLGVIIPLALALSFSNFTITPHPDMFALMLVLLSTFFTLKYILDGNYHYLAIAITSGFYAAFTREIALLTLFFVWITLFIKYRRRKGRLFLIIIPTLLLTGMGYWITNCIIKGTSIFYPILGVKDSFAYEWYTNHVSFWSILSHERWLQSLWVIGATFSVYIPLFFTKPRDRTLAFIFGCQIVFIFLIMPSSAGIDRYVMFTLPFLAIAWGNVFQNSENWLYIFIIGMLIVYPAQGVYLEKRIPDDFSKVTRHIDQNDFVLEREQAQIAYRTRCQAGWTSLFWSGDLFRTFQDPEKLENFIKKHGVTHISINKKLIIPADSPMIGKNAVGFPRDWVNEVKDIGSKIIETEHYMLYKV